MWFGVIAAAVAVLLFLGLQDVDLPFVGTALLDSFRRVVRGIWYDPQRRLGFGIIVAIIGLVWFVSRRTSLK